MNACLFYFMPFFIPSSPCIVDSTANLKVVLPEASTSMWVKPGLHLVSPVDQGWSDSWLCNSFTERCDLKEHSRVINACHFV